MGSDEPACVRGLQWRRYLDKAADLGVRSSGLKLTPLRRAIGEAHCANANNSSATPPPQISASAAPIHAALHLLARLITPPDRRAGTARTTPTSQPDRGVRRRLPAPPPPMLPIFMITPPARDVTIHRAMRVLCAGGRWATRRSCCASTWARAAAAAAAAATAAAAAAAAAAARATEEQKSRRAEEQKSRRAGRAEEQEEQKSRKREASSKGCSARLRGVPGSPLGEG